MALSTREIKERQDNPQEHERMVAEAAEEGLSYSAYLNEEYDPSRDGEGAAAAEGRSGWEVVMDHLGISSEMDPVAGIYPTRCEDIIGDKAAELALRELCLNAYRGIAYAPQINAAQVRASRRAAWERATVFQSTSDTPPGSSLTPYYDAMAHWDEDLEVDIMLEELTTRFEDTNKRDYRATILETDKDAFREEVRTPAADPPMATFGTSERPIQLKKRMLAIPFTYEHLREVEFVDKAMEHVEEIAVQRINAKVDEGLETFIFGSPTFEDDKLGGNIILLKELDSGATDTMTVEAWLNLQKRFKRSYMLSSAFGYDNDMTALQLAKIGGTNVMLVNMNERPKAVVSGYGGSFSVMNQLAQGTRIGWHDYLQGRVSTGTGNNKELYNCMVVIDKRKAAEYVSQMNTDIIETTRDMLKQTEYIVCSEIWGWISYQPQRAVYIIPIGNIPLGTTVNRER